MSCYSEHLSINLEYFSVRAGISVIQYIYNTRTLGHVSMVINIANLTATKSKYGLCIWLLCSKSERSS